MQSTWGGGTDIFLAKIHPGTGGTPGLAFSTYLGADNTYVPQRASRSGRTARFISPGYGGIGLPTSHNATQNGYAGGQSDGFLVVLTQTAAEFSQPKAIRSERVGRRPVLGR